MGAVDDTRLEQFEECGIGILPFKLDHSSDVLHLLSNERVIGIPISVQ